MTKTNKIHIECKNLWKVFGNKSQSVLEDIKRSGLGKEQAQSKHDCVIGVNDVSLNIYRGEIFCIMGLSGSGKSTLLRHINRLIEPTAGQVIVDGTDISTLNEKDLASFRSNTIGMVFQHMALWPHRSILDNVAYSLELSGVSKPERYKVAETVLDTVKLSGWGNKYPDELSGGMQQRVGLARALAGNPEILLMDEPFSALDPLIRTELQQQFLELSTTLDTTTLFITHDLEEAIRLGSRVAIMKDGVIVQVGTPEEILHNPADDYVKSFVKGMSRLRYVTAQQAMVPLEKFGSIEQLTTSEYIETSTNVKAIIDVVLTKGEKVVVAEDGIPVGVITTESLLREIREKL
jgi:glycine betaine/proline transport system ATP-binding protein